MCQSCPTTCICVEGSRSWRSVTFREARCQILDVDRKLIAAGNRALNLYYLAIEYQIDCQQTNAAVDTVQRKKEDIWHQRLGHLGQEICKS